MKIKTLIFNWFYTPENGEEYQKATVGKKFAESVVTEITAAFSEGEQAVYNIILENREQILVYLPNTVLYAAE